MKSLNRHTPISWNSQAFLIPELEQAIKDGQLRHYAYIPHKGEYDFKNGAVDKDHGHILLIPAVPLDWAVFYKRFEEPDPSFGAPICLHEDIYAPPQSARQELKGIASALLYFLHDKRFLEARDEERQFSYRFDDFVTDDCEWLNELFVYFSRCYGEFEQLCKPKRDVLYRWLDEGKITLIEAFQKHYVTPLEFHALVQAYKECGTLEKIASGANAGQGINRDTNYTLFLAQNKQNVNGDLDK